MQRLMIIGNLGRDPETRYTQSGKAITTLNVGASERKTDKDGNHVTETEWFRVVTFGSTAEACQKFLHKGSQIYVEGRLKTRTYTKDGQESRITEVLADNVQFLDRKENGQQKPAQHKGRGYRTTNEDCPDLGPACPSELANMDDIPF